MRDYHESTVLLYHLRTSSWTCTWWRSESSSMRCCLSGLQCWCFVERNSVLAYNQVPNKICAYSVVAWLIGSDVVHLGYSQISIVSCVLWDSVHAFQILEKLVTCLRVDSWQLANQDGAFVQTFEFKLFLSVNSFPHSNGMACITCTCMCDRGASQMLDIVLKLFERGWIEPRGLSALQSVVLTPGGW